MTSHKKQKNHNPINTNNLAFSYTVALGSSSSIVPATNSSIVFYRGFFLPYIISRKVIVLSYKVYAPSFGIALGSKLYFPQTLSRESTLRDLPVSILLAFLNVP